jgi:hypothetical protein
MSNNTHEHLSGSESRARPDSIQRLISGDFGLAKTYWIFGVAVGIVASLVVSGISNRLLLTLFSVAYLVYWTATSVGIWNAATKYEGNPAWAMLAKGAVVLGFIAVGHELYLLLFG